MPIRSVAIYCFENCITADPEKCNDEHVMAATLLGTELGKRGIDIVTGGMANGLMGVVANAALAAGGKVIGVIPEDFPIENRHPNLSERHIVADAYERKRLMMSLSDASVALPGGYGTESELYNEFDILKEVKKGYASAEKYGISPDRPIVIYDPDGFFVPVRKLAENMGAAKKNTKDVEMLKIAADPRKVLLGLGIMNRKEYDEIYAHHSEIWDGRSNEFVDDVLKPLSVAQKKRSFRQAGALLVGGMSAVVLGCIIPWVMPNFSATPELGRLINIDLSLFTVLPGILTAIEGTISLDITKYRPLVSSPLPNSQNIPA